MSSHMFSEAEALVAYVPTKNNLAKYGGDH